MEAKILKKINIPRIYFMLASGILILDVTIFATLIVLELTGLDKFVNLTSLPASNFGLMLLVQGFVAAPMFVVGLVLMPVFWREGWVWKYILWGMVLYFLIIWIGSSASLSFSI